MNKITTKQEFYRLCNEIPGKERGFLLKGYVDFILEKEGEKGLEKIQKIIDDFGYPLNLKEVKPLVGWYPVGFEVALLELIQTVFDYPVEKIDEIGRFAFKTPVVARLLAKHFVSLKVATKAVQLIWKEIFSVGRVEFPEVDEEKKYAIARIYDYLLSPVACHAMCGAFGKGVEFVVKGKVTYQEIKCISRGDPCHEIVFKWE